MLFEVEMKDLVILNFTGVYLEETFYLKEPFRWIDCSDIEGTDCLCDSEASDEICRRLSSVSPYGIHFIDSGDYHYISKFLTDKIDGDFILVLFDHHTDLQPSLFDGLLSCGSWVRETLDKNIHCRKVVLIGASDGLVSQIDDSYRGKVLLLSESRIIDKTGWEDFRNLHLTLPIYVSLDKDLLSLSEEHTNWDQGRTTLSDLQQMLSFLLDHDLVIGVDICGECPRSIRGLLDDDLRKDDVINLKLLRLLEGNDRMSMTD